MRDFIDKLERKYHRFAIPNLTMYLIACYVVGYVLYYVNPRILLLLNLNVSMILRGQIWRLVTWIIYPPSTGNFLLFLISIMFFYYPLGKSLDRAIGSFRYTLFIANGMLLTIIGAFLLHILTGGVYDNYAAMAMSTYYICLSVFLAFASLFPDLQILLWFVIPIRMKWMAIVYAAIVLYSVFDYIRYGYWFMIIPAAASLINFGLFYLGNKDISRYRPREVKRRHDFQKAIQPEGRVNPANVTKHKCAICGRTEKDSPDLEFRFCSKCNGNYEYCQDHLFTHTHVQ